MVEKKRGKRTLLPLPELQFIKVHSLSVKALPEDSGNRLLAMNWEVNINKDKEDNLSIQAKCEIGPDNKTDFEVIVEYEFKYIGAGKWTEAAIRERIEEFLQPCLAKNSLIVAHLTDYLYDEPIIIPPILGPINKKEESK